MNDNPTAVLIDVSGSQIGTPTNPFYVSGSSLAPTINITNVVNVNEAEADVSASFVLVGTTSSLPNGVLHSTLRQVVHLTNDHGPRGNMWPDDMVCDSDASPFPSGTVWWTDDSRTKKVLECVISRNSQQFPTSIQWIAYEDDGESVSESYTDTITYNGIFEESRTRSKP